MDTLTTEVLVIGGGSTGLGVARDAALRGFRTILVEKGDLAHGTTGRFHGLLHSGGRYAVKDPVSAKECIEENQILRRIAADCIEDTGGLFVCTPWDDPAYGDEFVRGCQACGVPADEISPAEALRREPHLNPKISRAFVVPDAAIDSFKTLWVNARDAQAHGAQILTYHKVERLVLNGQTVAGAVVQDERTGEERTISADFTVNAAGAWAGQIATMAGLKVTVLAGKGIMIAMNHRLVQTVVNRCKRPSDGDIIVPIRTVCVIGTTDVRVPDPDHYEIEPHEVQFMLDEGEKLVPGFRQARALRVWGGVRPLYQAEQAGDVKDTRDVSRTYTLLDHPTRDGVQHFLTITGGKFTTYRAMAQVAMDSVCRHLGTERPCTTATTPLPDSEAGRFYSLGDRLAKREASLHDDQTVCECELIPRHRLEAAFQQHATTSLDDIRRQLRLGMGPCQGGFCIYRATGILHEGKAHTAGVANTALCNFLQERWKGVFPLLWDDQMRQARLDEWIFQGLLDVEHLPPAGPEVNRMNYDAVIVGVGLAGLTAGLRLAQEGRRVLLLAKGVGGTHLGGGTIDVLGYGQARVDHPLAQLPDFLGAHPAHPYARAGLPALQAAVDWFLKLTGELGLPYVGSLADNFLLPTAVGVAKPAALVPSSMAAGDLRLGGKFVIAGFHNLKDFFPELLADNLKRASLPAPAEIAARAEWLEAPGLAREADLAPLDLARAFDRSNFRAALAADLKPRLQPGERVGLPAVIGLKDSVAAWQDLQNRLGAPVFEIPTLPPSIPGIRLFERLEAALRAGGARFQIGFPVIEARVEAGRCIELVTAGASRPYHWRGESVILATGGIASGGIVTESDGTVRESVFDLPLAGMPASDQPRFVPGYFDSQPFSQIGLDVDDQLRPVDAAGHAPIANLCAAGAMLGHAEPWREKSGDGISLTTGYRAAQVVLEAKLGRG